MEYPVKKGERLTVDILRAGDAGDGVAQVGGLTLFVEKTLPGETVEAVITEVQARFAKARAEKVVTPCANRIAPSCPHEKLCGGHTNEYLQRVRPETHYKRTFVPGSILPHLPMEVIIEKIR